MAEETETIEEETVAELEEERDGSGLGFIFGMLMGVVAGAAAATLFAPATGEEIRHRVSEEAAPLLKRQDGESDDASGLESGTAMARMRGMLTRVRSRVHEASEQAREAADESELQSQARYAELIHRDKQEGQEG